MIFLLGLICGLWIASFVILWVETTQSSLVEEEYRMPLIRPRWEDVE